MTLEKRIIVYDTETTGTHKGKKLLEIGAVCVNLTSQEFLDEFQMLVWQPEEVLDHPDSQKAFEIHRIPREDILNEGKPEDEAISDFADWIRSQVDKHGVESITAFNNKFDNGMVAPLFDMVNISVGDCLMLSSMPPMIAAGVAHRWPNQYRNDMLGLDEDDPQRYKWPKATEAKAYFESIGREFPGGPEHRALPDARNEAVLAIAIHEERINASIPYQDFEESYADYSTHCGKTVTGHSMSGSRRR